MRFTYPPTMADELARYWDEARPPRRGSFDALPDATLLRPLLEVAYHASFTTDEERKTRFSLALAPPSAVQAKIEFVRRLPFTVHEVTKLAPATHPDQTVICVETCGPGDLRIWGLLYDADPYRPADDNLYPIRMPFPIVCARSPGRLVVYGSGMRVAELKDGVLAPARYGALSSSLIRELFDPAVCETLVGLDYAMLGNAYDPARPYIERMISLVEQIRDGGHGGALFVLPDNFETALPGVLESMRMKYSSPVGSAWSGVMEASQSMLHSLTGRRGTPEAKEASDVALRHYARLAAVDGAVVMTDHFRLLGFGAEVLLHNELPKVFQSTGDWGESEPPAEVETLRFGTRHRSAFRFCAAHPGVVAFVCSQDGAVRTVTSREGRVTVWG